MASIEYVIALPSGTVMTKDYYQWLAWSGLTDTGLVVTLDEEQEDD